MLETIDVLLSQYVSLKTRGKAITGEKFQTIELWFSYTHEKWEKEAKSIDDLIVIGARNMNLLPGVSPDKYKNALNCLVMYQVMVHKQEIPGLLTEDEKRARKLQEIQKSSSLPESELRHLKEEAEILGDQREDIVSHGTYQLLDLRPDPIKRKRTS